MKNPLINNIYKPAILEKGKIITSINGDRMSLFALITQTGSKNTHQAVFLSYDVIQQFED